MTVKIIQASKPRTASTLLCNILYGLCCSGRAVIFHSTEQVSACGSIVATDELESALVIKTHFMDFDAWRRCFGDRHDVYFVCSERGRRQVDEAQREASDVLCFQFEELLESADRPLERIVSHVREKLSELLPGNVKLDHLSALRRVQRMNEVGERIKDEPFDHFDPFFHIHGSHRSRPTA